MLEIKYFVLKPQSKFYEDPYAYASRCAMYEYAKAIENHDPKMANELNEWANKEAEHHLKLNPNHPGEQYVPAKRNNNVQ